MRTSILRAFIPTDKCPIFEDNEDGDLIKLAGDVDPVHGCGESLSFDFRGERLSASVTPVRAGDRVLLKRGDGMRDVDQTFDKEGVLIDIPIPARRELLTALRGRGVPLAVRFAPTEGCYRSERGRECFLATGFRVAGVALAKSAEEADCELVLID